MLYPKFLKENDTIGVPAPSAGSKDKKKINRYRDAEKKLSELGYKLKKPLQKTASQKYGENQARLAEMLHLVTINDSAPKRVFVTRLGKYLNRYSFLEKENVIRSLLLQDPYIQHVVTATLHYSYNYSEVLTVLSRSTAMRRRQNVRKIVTFILSDEEFSDCLNHIDWEV